jgi:hypothetical protein
LLGVAPAVGSAEVSQKDNERGALAHGISERNYVASRVGQHGVTQDLSRTLLRHEIGGIDIWHIAHGRFLGRHETLDSNILGATSSDHGRPAERWHIGSKSGSGASAQGQRRY